MLWFKHKTDSLDDPFIVELMDKFKHQGYTFYFGLIGIICQQIGHDLDKKFECSPIYLKRKLRISTTKVIEMLDFCQTKGKLIYSFQKENLNIFIPNIAKIKDNYTKDLQAPGKKLSLDKNKIKNKIKNKSKKEDKVLPSECFNNFWKEYPNKQGKGGAKKTFEKNITTEGIFINLMTSLKNYKAIIVRDKIGGKFIKHGSSFMNQWEDFLEVEIVKERKEDYSGWGE